MKDYESFVVVGGNNSGLLAALSLRQRSSEIDIKVVDDFSKPQPNVGKSTYSSFNSNLHGFLGVDKYRFCKEVKPVFKMSVWFQDWCGYSFHVPFQYYTIQLRPKEKWDMLYGFYHNTDQMSLIETEIAENSKTPFSYNNGKLDELSAYAYHFEDGALNDFLRTLCEERGIDVIDDRIVYVDSSGSIISDITGQSGSTYNADLFIDSTGFSRVVAGQVGDQEFREFDAPVDKAVHGNFKRSEHTDIESATVVTSTEHGWRWSIDSYENRSVGRVFNSDITSTEAEKERLSDEIGQPIEELREKEFYTGYFKQSWRGNCICIGNSSGFIEPLQSTGLATSFDVARYLSDLLSTFGFRENERLKEMYNDTHKNIWEYTWPFIALHYTEPDKNSSEFWEHTEQIDLPEESRYFKETYDEIGLCLGEREGNLLRNTTEWCNLMWSPDYYFFLLLNLGVESDYYESVSPPSVDVRQALLEKNRQIERASKNYLTHDELYTDQFNYLPELETLS